MPRCARSFLTRVPTRLPGAAWLGLPLGAAPRLRPRAATSATATRRSRRFLPLALGHTASPSPPPCTLGFPVHQQVPSPPPHLPLRATQLQTLPRKLRSNCPLRPSSSQAKQTKEPREGNLPNSKAKSLLPSFLGSTFHFKNNKSRNQKPPRLEVGVRGNAGGGAWFPRCAAPTPLFWPLLVALMLSGEPPTWVTP